MILTDHTINSLDIVYPYNWFGEWHHPTEDYSLSWGADDAGYDIRVKLDQPQLTLHPNQMYLASTVEFFHIPNDVMGFLTSKSTLARQGLCLVPDTTLKPGWSGYLTLELFFLPNQGKYEFTLYDGQPIAQVIFARVENHTMGYQGKYQYQTQGELVAK